MGRWGPGRMPVLCTPLSGWGSVFLLLLVTVRMGVRVPAAVGRWQDGGPCSCCCWSLVVLRNAQRSGKCQLKGVITWWHPYSQEGSAAFREMSWSPARPCDLQEATGVTEKTAA